MVLLCFATFSLGKLPLQKLDAFTDRCAVTCQQKIHKTSFKPQRAERISQCATKELDQVPKACLFEHHWGDRHEISLQRLTTRLAKQQTRNVFFLKPNIFFQKKTFNELQRNHPTTALQLHRTMSRHLAVTSHETFRTELQEALAASGGCESLGAGPKGSFLGNRLFTFLGGFLSKIKWCLNENKKKFHYDDSY